MAKTDFKSIDEYISQRPRGAQPVLERVRRTIRKALPAAEEAISYQIPVFKLQGERVVYFAAWKEHYSLYPANERLVAAFKDELAALEVSKGTIRFSLSRPVPVRLIAGIAKFLAKEAAARAAAKRARKKKR
jgi:uncharacterized protein YdhG (YjbR/CyaY superfamily)